jgi:hypothetical protein
MKQQNELLVRDISFKFALVAIYYAVPMHVGEGLSLDFFVLSV